VPQVVRRVGGDARAAAGVGDPARQRPALPRPRRRPVRGGGRVAVRRAATGRGGVAGSFERRLAKRRARACAPACNGCLHQLDDGDSNTLHVSHPTRVNHRRRKRIACACVIAGSPHHGRPYRVEVA
jgi:hypothetical protein